MTDHNHLASMSNEWYTPSRYVEAVRDVLGAIDLDPASTAEADVVVKANRFFSPVQDGLRQDWHGRVFLNPPWGRIGPLFVAKLLEEYRRGMVEAAVLLCAARTETRWFQPLFEHTICFPAHRIKFWNPQGTTQPTTTPVFTYLGADAGRFAVEFEHFGPVVRRWRRRLL